MLLRTLLLLVVITLASCGVKGPPKPYFESNPMVEPPELTPSPTPTPTPTPKPSQKAKK